MIYTKVNPGVQSHLISIKESRFKILPHKKILKLNKKRIKENMTEIVVTITSLPVVT